VSKILSQEEIDSLLASSSQLGEAVESRQRRPRRQEAVVYNFRRPDRVSKEQIRSLHFLHDRFARNTATSLSAYLRTVTDLSIMSVEQFTYSEFLMSLPDPTAYYAISMAPLEGLMALELNPNVAFTMIDLMLGGSGHASGVSRAFTEIEQNVTDAVVKLVLENLTDTWRAITEVHFEINGRETRPQMLQIAAPNEVVLLLGFDIRVGESRGMLNVCLPASTIEAVGAQFTRQWHRTSRVPSIEQQDDLFTNIGRVPVPVTAVLDARMTARELIALKPGDLVSLGHPVRSPLRVQVSGVPKFEGRPTRVRDAVGLAVDRVLNERTNSRCGGGAE